MGDWTKRFELTGKRALVTRSAQQEYVFIER